MLYEKIILRLANIGPTLMNKEIRDCRTPLPIGLYRENAIAIQKESGDSNGGNV